MSTFDYSEMIQHKGAGYRDSKIKSYSHYRDSIDHSAGRAAGNSRIWGDANQEVQAQVIDKIIFAAQKAGLDNHQTAYVLAIAKVESGFNPDAAAGTTSAYGLGQFIDETGKNYGLNRENRSDVDRQAKALVAHFKDNYNLVKNRGKNEEYIYKYHHDGPNGEYGGLKISKEKIIPLLGRYEKFVERHNEQFGKQAAVDINKDKQAELKSKPSNLQKIEFGDSGKHVEQLQKNLNDLGFQLKADGDFGNKTKQAVIDYQKQHQLTADGIIGEKTFSAIEHDIQNKKIKISEFANGLIQEAKSLCKQKIEELGFKWDHGMENTSIALGYLALSKGFKTITNLGLSDDLKTIHVGDLSQDRFLNASMLSAVAARTSPQESMANIAQLEQMQTQQQEPAKNQTQQQIVVDPTIKPNLG